MPKAQRRRQTCDRTPQHRESHVQRCSGGAQPITNLADDHVDQAFKQTRIKRSEHFERDFSIRRPEGFIQFFEVPFGEFYVERGAVLANMIGIAGLRNHHHVRMTQASTVAQFGFMGMTYSENPVSFLSSDSDIRDR